MTAETPDLSIANCERIAAGLRGKAIVNTLLRPKMMGLAPLDAMQHVEDCATLRGMGLLDDQNEWTRLGRRVQACL